MISQKDTYNRFDPFDNPNCFYNQCPNCNTYDWTIKLPYIQWDFIEKHIFKKKTFITKKSKYNKFTCSNCSYVWRYYFNKVD
jgi:hypothetical protein